MTLHIQCTPGHSVLTIGNTLLCTTKAEPAVACCTAGSAYVHTYLHGKLDELHHLLELGGLVDLKVVLLQVEPPLAHLHIEMQTPLLTHAVQDKTYS